MNLIAVLRYSTLIVLIYVQQNIWTGVINTSATQGSFELRNGGTKTVKTQEIPLAIWRQPMSLFVTIQRMQNQYYLGYYSILFSKRLFRILQRNDLKGHKLLIRKRTYTVDYFECTHRRSRFKKKKHKDSPIASKVEDKGTNREYPIW